MEADVAELVNLDVDLDKDPMCSGMEIVQVWTGRHLRQEDCDRRATWSRTTKCCVTTTSLKCDYHRELYASYSGWTCSICARRNSNTVWRRI